VRALLIAAAVSFSFTLFLTPVFLRLFRKLGWGQVIRTPELVGNPQHGAKRGTPTMGGTIFILGTIVGYVTGMLAGGGAFSLSAILVIWAMVGFGLVGFIDDFLKVKSQRSLGLSGWSKIVGQLLVIIPFAVVSLNFPNEFGETPASPYISIFRDIPSLWFFALTPVLGWAIYLIWISIIGISATNGANISDGLDGLATGSGIFVVGGFSLIAFWKSNQSCYREGLDQAVAAACYEVRDPLSLATVSAAFAAALIGFLWWNAPKAKLFMGDVGSMAIGGVVAAMAILTRTELLLLLLGGIFVLAPGSVILQRIYKKLTGGKQIFLVSPFHHHLEMIGWPEITVVVRLWIVAGVMAVMGVGFFYVEWLSLV
jgi:phospho-N-acetylmuramoyl-pentapeptide-transferase